MKEEMLEKVYNAKKNVIVSGDISIGKTTGVMFPLVKKMIQNNESFLVVDSKEEYISNYYQTVKEKNYNVIIINLKEPDKSDGWNPLTIPYHFYKNGDTDKSMDYLERFGSVLFQESETEDPFWSRTSSDFFTGVLLGLFEDAKEDEVNLLSATIMIDSISKKFGKTDFIRSYFETKEKNSRALTFVAPTIFAPNETKGSILSVLRQRLRVYISREKINQLTNQTTFKFEDIVNKPTAIFIIPSAGNRQINGLASIFIEQLYTLLLDNKLYNEFNFILDNFDDLISFYNLSEMMSSGIARNLKFLLVTRSIDKLYKDCGSYIEKLCNKIKVNNDKIDFDVNNEIQVVSNEPIIVNYDNSNIEYPQLKSSEIKLFDIEEYVRQYTRQSILNAADQKTSLTDKETFDALNEKITSRLAELDKEKNEMGNNVEKKELSQDSNDVL